jgi:DUF1009 family protein
MDRHVIFGVHLTNRLTHANRVQEVFTEFGAHIKTRLGLHDVGQSLERMSQRLAAIEGVEVQRMVFTH